MKRFKKAISIGLCVELQKYTNITQEQTLNRLQKIIHIPTE